MWLCVCILSCPKNPVHDMLICSGNSCCYVIIIATLAIQHFFAESLSCALEHQPEILMQIWSSKLPGVWANSFSRRGWDLHRISVGWMQVCRCLCSQQEEPKSSMRICAFVGSSLSWLIIRIMAFLEVLYHLACWQNVYPGMLAVAKSWGGWARG